MFDCPKIIAPTPLVSAGPVFGAARSSQSLRRGVWFKLPEVGLSGTLPIDLERAKHFVVICGELRGYLGGLK